MKITTSLFIIAFLCHAATSYLIIKQLDFHENNQYDDVIDKKIKIAQNFIFNGVKTSFEPITREIVRWDRAHLDEYGDEIFVGKIVLVPGNYSYDDVLYFMPINTSGVIIATALVTPGRLSLSMGAKAVAGGWTSLGFQISAFEEYADVLWELFDKNVSIVVTITDEGNENRWEIFAESPTMFILQVALVAYSLVPVVYIVHMYFTTEKFAPLAMAVLSVEFFCGIYRTFFFAWDPANIRKMVRVELNLYLAQVPAPFSIATTVGVLLFWNIITKYSPKTIQITKVVALIFNILALMFGFVFVPIMLLFVDDITTNMIASIIYIFLSLILSIYTFITVPNILKIIDNSSRQKMLKEKTILIIVSGILSFLWCIPPIIWIFPSIGYAEFLLTSWMIWFFILVSISFSQILVFRIKKPKSVTTVHIKTATK